MEICNRHVNGLNCNAGIRVDRRPWPSLGYRNVFWGVHINGWTTKAVKDAEY